MADEHKNPNADLEKILSNAKAGGHNGSADANHGHKEEKHGSVLGGISGIASKAARTIFYGMPEVFYNIGSTISGYFSGSGPPAKPKEKHEEAPAHH